MEEIKSSSATLEQKMKGNNPKDIYFGLVDLLEYFNRMCFFEYLISDSTLDLEKENYLVKEIKDVLVSEKSFFLKDELEENKNVIFLYSKIDSFFESMKCDDDRLYQFSKENWNEKTKEIILSMKYSQIEESKKRDNEKKLEILKSKNSISIADTFYPETVKSNDEEW